MRSERKIYKITATILFLFVSLSCIAQSDDARQINALIKNLSDHRTLPNVALDPTLDAKMRQKSLNYLNDPSFQLTLDPTGALRMETGDRATLPVRVHFVTATEQSDWDSDATFVRRNGTWYFANYDFLSTPIVLIFVFIGGFAIAISWTVVLLVLSSRLLKHRQFYGVNIIKAFIPFFWKELFRQTRDS